MKEPGLIPGKTNITKYNKQDVVMHTAVIVYTKEQNKMINCQSF